MLEAVWSLERLGNESNRVNLSLIAGRQGTFSGEKFGTQGTAPGTRGTSAPGEAVGARGVWFQLFL
jgi:hypothetical protein